MKVLGTLLRSTDALLLAMVAIWAINFSVVKWGVEAIPPLPFNAIRFLIASSIVLAARRLRGWRPGFQRRDRWRLLGLGLMGNTLYQVLFILGISRTTAGNCAFILALTPVVVIAGEWMAGRRSLNRVGMLGVFLSCAGLAAVVFGKHGVQLGAGTLVGDLLVLAATILWGAYTVLIVPLMARYSSNHVTMATLVSGTPLLILIALPGAWTVSWNQVAPAAWLAVLYSGALAIAASYLIWNLAVQRVGGARTAVYSNLTPILAALIGWALLGETWTAIQTLGAAGVVLGVFLSRAGGSAPVTGAPGPTLDSGSAAC